jgi:gamma-D-glutamyl-L-lysine dipeptidyl-peptidase
MKKNPFLLLLGLLMACATGQPPAESASAPAPATSHVEAVRQQHAPDARTALFQVTPRGRVLVGETNLPAAKAELLARLQEARIAFTDSIQVLPAAGLAGKHHAVVTVSVANLRSAPRHPAELATQATLGTPLRVLKKDRGWYLVQTPDLYLSWVDAGGIQLLDEAGFGRWQQGRKLLYTHPYGFAYAQPDAQAPTVSDLVYGAVLELRGQKDNFYEVGFPDGRTAYVAAAEAADYRDWARTRLPSEENLVQTARQLMGLPYLWGGTSFKGVDCSGFTKTVYFMNGLVLPRDASQQVHLGEEVSTQNGWGNLRPGDLLFFGTPAQDGKPERVVHVGMWIGGEQEFIHSASRVRVSSMNPASPQYDDFELKRFLRAKRIPPQATLLDVRTAPLYE